MLVSQKTHRQTRLQNIIFVVLLIAVIGSLAWLSTRYRFEADWTANSRHTLSAASTALLDTLTDNITITSYATEDENLRRTISELVARYQRHNPAITLEFVNPDLVPDTIRQLGITSNGEMVIAYQGRQENLKTPTEEGITNTLQRLARSGERWLVFLGGHGERRPQGGANHDYDGWAEQLKSKGFRSQTINLTETPQLPDNTRVLVIASPQVELLPGEITLIQQYIEKGGNLLLLTDPGPQHGLEKIYQSLGVQLQPGIIVDPTTQVLGISDPRFAIVADYPQHEITQQFDTITLFPQAVGLNINENATWQDMPLLRTAKRTWSETGDLSGSIQYDDGQDIAGPLNLGVAITRKASDSLPEDLKNQRIVLIGDGDFLSNAYLGNGGNQQLGLNIMNWLALDDQFITIPVKTATDKNLELSATLQAVIGIGFLFVLPALLAGSGLAIWLRRRKR